MWGLTLLFISRCGNWILLGFQAGMIQTMMIMCFVVFVFPLVYDLLSNFGEMVKLCIIL